MPLWSQEFNEPPWSKKHTVTLQTRDRCDELARKGGSDKNERHKPLQLAGGHGRKAGASDPVNAEPHVTEMFDAGMITPTKYVLIISHD